MKKEELLKDNVWWTMIPFVALSLTNKIWTESDVISTVAWAFMFLWCLTECVKNKKKASFIIEAILCVAVFIVLAWNIADLI